MYHIYYIHLHMEKLRKQIDIPRMHLKRLKILAVNDGVSLKEWIEQLILKQLK